MADNYDAAKLATAVHKARSQIDGAVAARSEANTLVREALEHLETLGVHRDAMRMAMRYSEWDETKRQGFDFAYNFVRETFKLPVQAELFEPALTADERAEMRAGPVEEC